MPKMDWEQELPKSKDEKERWAYRESDGIGGAGGTGLVLLGLEVVLLYGRWHWAAFRKEAPKIDRTGTASGRTAAMDAAEEAVGII